MKALQTTIQMRILALGMALISCEGLEQISPKSAEAAEASSKKKNTPTLAALLTTQTPVSYELRANQAYGSDPFQVYDLYKPVFANGDSAKSVAVVLVHGGGWSLLDKSYLSEVV